MPGSEWTAFTGKFLGLGLVLADVASLAAMIVLPALGVLRRVTVEEAALRSALGDSYVAYSQGRARLIPGIW
jgi:protein-S-isoprenylcysteine O-methyltransferase Ste14